MIAKFVNKYEEAVDAAAEDDYVTNDNNESQTNQVYQSILNNIEALEDRDPILLSFKNASKAREKGSFYVEYQSKYDEVVEENFDFATQILNLCKNQKEARCILQKQKVLHYICSLSHHY